jgi:hypothetical protein
MFNARALPRHILLAFDPRQKPLRAGFMPLIRTGGIVQLNAVKADCSLLRKDVRRCHFFWRPFAKIIGRFSRFSIAPIGYAQSIARPARWMGNTP